MGGQAGRAAEVGGEIREGFLETEWQERQGGES